MGWVCLWCLALRQSPGEWARRFCTGEIPVLGFTGRNSEACLSGRNGIIMKGIRAAAKFAQSCVAAIATVETTPYKLPAVSDAAHMYTLVQRIPVLARSIGAAPQVF